MDDATRRAYVEVLADERADTTVAFFDQAVAWFAGPGVPGPPSHDRQRRALHLQTWRAWLAARGIGHIRAPPYRPAPLAKQSFIQTMLREWAYAAVYRDSAHRHRVLRPWLRTTTTNDHTARPQPQDAASRLLAD